MKLQTYTTVLHSYPPRRPFDARKAHKSVNFRHLVQTRFWRRRYVARPCYQVQCSTNTRSVGLNTHTIRSRCRFRKCVGPMAWYIPAAYILAGASVYAQNLSRTSRRARTIYTLSAWCSFRMSVYRGASGVLFTAHILVRYPPVKIIGRRSRR